MCIRPKTYDRIFSILVDDDMFQIASTGESDERIDPDTGSTTNIDSAAMSKYEVTISLANHNFHYDYGANSTLPNDSLYQKINLNSFDISNVFPFQPSEEEGLEYITALAIDKTNNTENH